MDLQIKIKIVLLMAKFEISTQVRRTLQTEGWKDIPAIATISNNYLQ